MRQFLITPAAALAGGAILGAAMTPRPCYVRRYGRYYEVPCR